MVGGGVAGASAGVGDQEFARRGADAAGRGGGGHGEGTGSGGRAGGRANRQRSGDGLAGGDGDGADQRGVQILQADQPQCVGLVGASGISQDDVVTDRLAGDHRAARRVEGQNVGGGDDHRQQGQGDRG